VLGPGILRYRRAPRDRQLFNFGIPGHARALSAEAFPPLAMEIARLVSSLARTMLPDPPAAGRTRTDPAAFPSLNASFTNPDHP